MFYILSTFNYFVSIFIFLVGLCVGSFINVLIDRLPNGESIGGRSYCDHCKKRLEAIDLIPVLSFFFLLGKCRTCHKRLVVQYPIVEFITGVTFLIIWLYFGFYLTIVQLLAYFLLAAVCIVIVGTDLKYHIIPDSMTALFILSALVIGKGDSIATQLSGGVVLFLVLYGIYLVTRGKMMGFGDVKLAFGMGILFGVIDGLIALYLSFLIGGIVSIFLLLSGKSKLKSKIAFGPFMILGTVLMLLYSQQIHGVIEKIF